ncbi:MAG: His/Gly/Thr/Pro-type tRNA ligase C-terminal domain-containing protein, partial [Armatimonadota bacterium]|nr:His/Gly/Thr/Pro-type tRNA ligase C-terminal domain-containing protein [Armatimonadota bacterium]
EQAGLMPEDTWRVEVYVASSGPRAEEEAFGLLDRLREVGFRAEGDLMGRSLSAQLRHAARLGAQHAVILEDAGLERKEAVVRDLRTGVQRTVSLDRVVGALREGVG